ncbi:aromatic amino acid transport family protein [Dongshaea marina]|uniref:aromatic amino acid transport family protein n=1 Tax=Dongshaea marina TaxID=2047966 RepID=UPI000D3E8E0B|nr:aromatic amino acid transport family protein [Dongshaea marina]
MLGLFGTAVGAGILFLPINAGMGGFWPLILMTVLVGPMTYLAHRNLARFVLSSKSGGDSNITNVVEEHFGSCGGKLITVLYFFAIYPILLIYGVGVTNTVQSFIVHQLHLPEVNRPLLSLILIGALMGVMLTGEKLMLIVCEFLVYPLILILLGLSLYLIPHWSMTSLNVIPTGGSFVKTLWLTIPVLVFSFNHSPAISQFSVSQRKKFADKASQKTDTILRRNSYLLLFFVMLFVFSCVLSLTPAELQQAKAENISILSFMANESASPVISYLGPVIAFIAIVSSFFGHYLGTREGLNGIISQQAQNFGKEITQKKTNLITNLFILITLWIVAIINPSILDMITSIGGPIIAMILFIMPVYAIYKVPALQKYRKNAFANAFICIMGLVAISGLLYSMFS